MSKSGVSATLAIISIFYVLCSQASAASAEETSAERLYESAFRLIVEGDYSEAYDQLEGITAEYPDTVYARFAEDRKRQLEELNLPSIRRRGIDQSGRIGTVVFSTLYSTWLGIGSARLAKADSDKAVATGMMIGAPVGLLTSLALTRNAKLSKGQAALINFSGYWGTWQGYGLAILLDKNDDEKTMIGGTMAGGLLGILTTSVLTRKIDISSGDVSMIHYGGLWGTWLSFLAGYLADVEDDDNHLVLVLAGGNLSTAAMAALCPKIEISFVRASLINLSGVAGTMVAGGLLLITQPDNPEAFFGTLMAGGILGLVAGGFGTTGFNSDAASQEPGHERLSRAMNSQSCGINSGGIQAELFSVRF